MDDTAQVLSYFLLLYKQFKNAKKKKKDITRTNHFLLIHKSPTNKKIHFTKQFAKIA